MEPEIVFEYCNAGWIFFVVLTDEWGIDLRASDCYDCFPDFMDWLEKLAAGEDRASFQIDGEGDVWEFSVERVDEYNDEFRINEAYSKKILRRCVVDRKNLVRNFYTSFVCFSFSDEYDPHEWTSLSFGEAWEINMRGKANKEELLSYLLLLDHHELVATIYEFHKRYFQGRPDFYHIPEDYFEWPLERRRWWLLDYMNEFEWGYDGVHLRELRSTKVEEYLHEFD